MLAGLSYQWISFGNYNDRESDVYKIRQEQQVNRNFYVLEQLHVLPNVSYLAKIRNTDRHVGVVEEDHIDKGKDDEKGHG